MPTFALKTCLAAEFVGCRHFAAVFSLQVPKSFTDLDLTVLYISVFKFWQKTKMLVLSSCFPQPCSSDGRRFAASKSRLNCYRTIGLFPQKRIWWQTLYTGFPRLCTFVRTKSNPALNVESNRLNELMLGHLGQSIDIHDSRTHRVL